LGWLLFISGLALSGLVWSLQKYRRLLTI